MRSLTRLVSMPAAVVLLVCWVARAQSPPADLRGIYVDSNEISQITDRNATALAASLRVPGVDGLVLVIGWDAIEPAMGQYQWTTLDQWMSQAIASGKKVDLSVRAGISTPSWLFQPAPGGAGAQALSFLVARKNGQKGVCESETIAAPWDPAFLARWDALLAALSSHLKSVGTYSAVSLLRLTGINRDTDELHLPAETAQSTGLACVSDAITTWQQAGYRPSLLLQGWNAVISSFQKSFPDKSFSVAIITGAHPFPPIAEDGSVITGAVPNQNLPLLTLASQKLPGHLVIQNNFLMPGAAAASETIQAAQSLGTPIAFQTNEYFGDSGQGAACGGTVNSPTPCTAATFLAMLQTGIYPLGESSSLRAQYIEVFAANVNAFPEDIQQAHLELLAPPS